MKAGNAAAKIPMEKFHRWKDFNDRIRRESHEKGKYKKLKLTLNL